MKDKKDVIDFEHLARYTGGDAALEAEIFALFREQLALWMRLLVPDADAESWQSATHSLKGSSKGVGAMAMADACAAAENIPVANTIERALAVQNITKEAERIVHFLDKRDHKARIQALRRSSKRPNS